MNDFNGYFIGTILGNILGPMLIIYTLYFIIILMQRKALSYKYVSIKTYVITMTVSTIFCSLAYFFNHGSFEIWYLVGLIILVLSKIINVKYIKNRLDKIKE